jgi:hypothetical protein
LLTALGSPYHSRPNGNASLIRSTPRACAWNLSRVARVRVKAAAERSAKPEPLSSLDR